MMLLQTAQLQSCSPMGTEPGSNGKWFRSNQVVGSAVVNTFLNKPLVTVQWHEQTMAVDGWLDAACTKEQRLAE